MRSAALGRDSGHNSNSNLTLGSAKKRIKVTVIDLETNISTDYNSMSDAAKAVNAVPSTV